MSLAKLLPIRDTQTVSVLNPYLFALMRSKFGDVHVINRGQELEGYYTNTMNCYGTVVTRFVITRRGESYIANCPCCGDERRRLSVNYKFGIYDDMTSSRGFELWKCYNEECQNDPDKRKQFIDELYYTLVKNKNDIEYQPNFDNISSTSEKLLQKCEFPGELIPINKLPDTHIAVKYLRGDRKFDLDELYNSWGISYSPHVESNIKGAASQGCIIIPVTFNGVMIGWQARYPGELDWKLIKRPKYLTYYPKSLSVYGIDYVKDSKYVVLVEGATDVWRYGYGAVCFFGKKASLEQATIMAKRLNNRPLVLIPDRNDPDSEAGFFDSASMIRNQGYSGPVGIVVVPDGLDPAKLSREQLHSMVEEAVESAKVF